MDIRVYSIPHDTPESIPFDTETILFTALYASPIHMGGVNLNKN